uniref:SH3 domain-containing protein n=1 Tax=Steinernema glaseri TaxID=37863 RepID=A0A1I7ZW42_9BILA
MWSAVSPVHARGFQEAALGLNQLGDSKITNHLRVQQHQEVAAQRLLEAKAEPVLFAIRANVAYDGALDDDVPAPGRAISFDVGHFLHIIRKFNENWWIGRLVKDGAELGFVPSPSKLEQLKEHKRRRILTANSCFAARLEEEAPYDVVPSMRPIIFVGPALKGYTVTDMMHKAIFDFLKERFRGRIIISRVVVDLDAANKASPNKLLLSRNSIKKGEQRVSWLMEETERIYKMCRLMQLVVLDCDQVNHPGQLHKSSIAPIVVHIKVSNQKVLQRLIKERGKKKSRAMKVQLLNAEKLGQCPDSLFDLIVDDNQLEDACEHIADFLETYWRATHPNA